MTKFAFSAGVAATSVLTSTGVFVDTQTVVVGGKTYTSQTSLTNVDGNFLAGASAAAGLLNLFDAINVGRGVAEQGGGVGVGYATLMTRNKQVFASAVDATTLTVFANVLGTIGNLIPTTETQTNFSWTSTVMASGTGDSGIMLDEIIAEIDHLKANAQLNSDVLMHFAVLRDALVVLAPEA